MSETSRGVLTRRSVLALGAGAAALGLAACSGSSRQLAVLNDEGDVVPADVREMYGPVRGEPHPVPAVNLSNLDRRYWRQVVSDPTGERPGTIVVSTRNRYLYLVQEDGMALRYGVGIGRDGFEWSGRGYIARKARWPTWTPPAAMIEREPYLEEYRNGMPGGPQNPLGARALYIYEDGRDTLYRLHGNPDERSIGRAVSSGCVRLLQQDIIDLYQRVPTGTNVIVT